MDTECTQVFPPAVPDGLKLYPAVMITQFLVLESGQDSLSQEPSEITRELALQAAWTLISRNPHQMRVTTRHCCLW